MDIQSKSKTTLDLSYVRSKFPALKNDFVFMDNAGGSQTLGGVMDKIVEYLTHYDVQLGASYEVSVKAGALLSDVVNQIANLVNASRHEEVVLGSSATMLLRILSICLSQGWKSGDEVIVTNSDHEANVSCWTDLRKQGIEVKIWQINAKTLEFEIDDLKALLTSKTKLVTMTHVSNILGTINPVKAVSEVVHKAGALFCVDGVAYAPHRLVDVQAMGVDFYVFSFYKVYGPHMGMLYGRYELLREMDGLNHYFIGKDAVPYKFQPGSFSYELGYSLLGITEYLEDLHDFHYPEQKGIVKSQKYKHSFDLISAHEETLAKRLLDYLLLIPEITIIGASISDREKRVPTLAFVHSKISSKEVVRKVDAFRIGIRFGDFYAKKSCRI